MPTPSPAASPSPSSAPSGAVPPVRGTLCPYCGTISSDPKRCDDCRGHFDPLSRQATQNAMGPWFIRDEKSPFRPGCSFETLADLVRRGKVGLETVIRGPTTRQLWSLAGRTPGVANLLGVCHACRGTARVGETACGSCGASFAASMDRQHLGLAPVHLLPGQASPDAIARAVMPPGDGPRS